MAIYARASASISHRTEVTMRVSMSVEDWLKLRQQLGASYPSNDLGAIIDGLEEAMHQPVPISILGCEGFEA